VRRAGAKGRRRYRPKSALSFATSVAASLFLLAAPDASAQTPDLRAPPSAPSDAAAPPASTAPTAPPAPAPTPPAAASPDLSSTPTTPSLAPAPRRDIGPLADPPISEPVAGNPGPWDPSWRRFGVWDYAGTAATLGAFYLVESMSAPTKSHWNGPILLDKPFRNFIVASSREGRSRADDLSDIFWYVSVAYPVAASLAVPPVRGKGGAAMSWQLTMMNLEAFAVVSVLTRLPHKTIGRKRPNTVGCEDDPNYSDQCGSPAQIVSFFGGHTAVSMTGAGLACAHHLNGHLYGSPTADAIACGAAVAAGQMVSIFRLQADKHWLSDNLTGTLVGFGVGFGMPTFLHYHPFWRSKNAEPDTASKASPGFAMSILPVLGPGSAGAAVGGAF
jgi:PAP2 superfamily protein